MAGVTLTTADAFLKNVYLPGISDWMNNQHPIFKRVRSKIEGRDFKGRKWIFAAVNAYNQANGAVGEGEVLPVAQSTSYVNMEMALKYHYQICRMTAQSMKLASGEGAFGSSMTDELDRSKFALKNNIAKHVMFGDGSGALGTVSSYSTPTVTMKKWDTNNGEPGTRLLDQGMLVSSYSAKTAGSQGADAKAILTIPSATTFTSSAAAGFNSNDYIFQAITAGVDPRNKSIMGLNGIIDDGTVLGTFQTLSRTTYPLLKANVLGNSGTLRSINQDLLDSLCTESQVSGGGMPPTALYSHLYIINRMAAYLKVDRRYDMGVKKLDGGYSGVEWTAPGSENGAINWYADNYAVPNAVYAPREPDMVWAKSEDFAGVDEDGRLWRTTDRTDAFEFWMRFWGNLGSRQCNNHSVLRDISMTA